MKKPEPIDSHPKEKENCPTPIGIHTLTTLLRASTPNLLGETG